MSNPVPKHVKDMTVEEYKVARANLLRQEAALQQARDDLRQVEQIIKRREAQNPQSPR